MDLQTPICLPDFPQIFDGSLIEPLWSPYMTPIEPLKSPFLGVAPHIHETWHAMAVAGNRGIHISSFRNNCGPPRIILTTKDHFGTWDYQWDLKFIGKS